MPGAYLAIFGALRPAGCAMRWTMVMPIAVVILAAASCLLIRNQAAGQDGATADGAESGQMAGTISSPGSSGQSPGSPSGAGS
jgi:hypothetical protein